MAKKENSKYTYAMFSEALPLAFSLSSMYTRATLNMPRKLRIRNKRYHLIGLSIIATDLDRYSIIACTWKPRLDNQNNINTSKS